MRLGHLARDHVELLEDDGDLREVHPGHAVLLGQGAQRGDLVDLPLVDERRGERHGGGRPLLRAERGVELLLGDELALEEDLAEGPLVVALVVASHGPRALCQPDYADPSPASIIVIALAAQAS